MRRIECLGRAASYKRSVDGLVGCLLLAIALPAWGMDEAEAWRRALAQHEEAIVRVETVVAAKMSMAGQGQEEESRMDLTGAIVHPEGLIMLWNASISSSRLNEMLADMGQSNGFKMEITPTAFTVQIGSEELPAFLAATDSALDLAFIQLEAVPEESLPFVDFAAAADLAVGEKVLQVQRLGRSFDDASHLASARVSGMLRKPRAAWMVDGELGGFGLPVFDLQGRPVGALTTIYSRAGEDSASGFGMGPMSGFFGQGSPFSALHSFILPGKRVASLVGLAREQAIELAERRDREAQLEAADQP